MSIDDLLDLPSAEAVRRRALALLDSAVAVAPRLADPSDAQALHDFRVSLRRLRALLKLHRAELGGRLDRLRKKLGQVAALTGDARDAEVQLTWLHDRRRCVPRPARPALDWLCGRLEERKDAGYARARTVAAALFARTATRLRRRLRRYEIDLEAERDGGTLAETTARLAREQGGELAGILATVNEPSDEAPAHRARIAGKQVRYLLEPLADSQRAGAEARAAVKELRKLQDVLGELHDVHVFARQLDELAAKASEARLRAGLISIAALVRARRDELHAALLGARDRLPALDAVAARLAPAVGAQRPLVLAGLEPPAALWPRARGRRGRRGSGGIALRGARSQAAASGRRGGKMTRSNRTSHENVARRRRGRR